VTAIRDSHRIRQQLATARQVAVCVFSRGFVDLFRNPKAAARYWHRIVAALYPAEGEAEPSFGLSKCNIEQIIPGAESIPVTLIEYQYAYGDMPVTELMALCRIVRHRQPKVIFEIGTYLGGTTLQLAANTQAEVYTLDLSPPGHKDYVQPRIWDPESDVYPDQPGIRFQGSQYESRIHQLFGDSQKYDFTPYYGAVDLVFVDGCHHYEFVLRDSHNALKIMSPDGVVIWHDYASYAPGVVQALNELAKVVPLVHIAETSLVMYHRREGAL